MEGLPLAILYAGGAGAMVPAGALLARIEALLPGWLETEVRHSVIAFGGGVLLAAVCFVLVPEGERHLPGAVAVVALLGGGALFALIDRAIERRAGRGAQLLALLADYLPEAAALGAMLAAGGEAAGLLALLIGLQNLPEAFNACRELADAGEPGRRLLPLFAAIAFLGPLAAVAGFLLLSGTPSALGAIMLGAGGGIVFLTFQDIAVESHLSDRQSPALAAVAGFALGLAGHLATG